MPRRRKAVQVPRREAKSFLAKAAQFLDEAQIASSANRHDATMLNAIHAAISANDAVTVALAGRRSTDTDHLRAADLLEEVGAGGGDLAAKARQLRSILVAKNAVEYESRAARATEAKQTLDRATRIVSWAADVVGKAKLD